MTCEGTVDDVLNTIRKTPNRNSFMCCGGDCIKIADISTIQTVREERPPDDDDDGRPVVRGVEVDVEGPRDSWD
jgi:hypothetical protein